MRAPGRASQQELAGLAFPVDGSFVTGKAKGRAGLRPSSSVTGRFRLAMNPFGSGFCGGQDAGGRRRRGTDAFGWPRFVDRTERLFTFAEHH